MQMLTILKMLTGYRELTKAEKSPFKHAHFAFFPLKPRRMANRHCNHLSLKCESEMKVSLVIFSAHCALFPSPGSPGESPIFSPTSWVPAAVHFVTVIRSRPTGRLSGSAPASPWERMRERRRRGGHWSQGLSATVSIFRGITHFGPQGCSREE